MTAQSSRKSADCNENGVPDHCDITFGAGTDCNGNGLLDECDIANGTSKDINGNGMPDECDSPGFGDLNCDLFVDAFDIEPFIVAVFEPWNYPTCYPECNITLGDINHDGFVNTSDIETFLERLFP